MPATFFIRPALPTDASAILDVHRAAIRGSSAETAYSCEIIDSWAPLQTPAERIERLTRSIEQSDEVVLVAEETHGRLIAFGSIVPRNSELRALYVSTGYVRQGIGKAIVEQLEHRARELHLTELRLDSSINAQAFYEATGFISLERGEHVSPTGVRMSCIHMRKSL